MSTKSSLTLTRQQCRAVDQYAIEQLGIPGIVLMENAGRNAAELITQWIPRTRYNVTPQTEIPDLKSQISDFKSQIPDSPSAAVLCGKGNNGGDGFVIARHLLRHHWHVTVYLAADPSTLTGDAATSYAPLGKLGIDCVRIDAESAMDCRHDAWDRVDVIVDALLGTGFSGQVREPLLGIIRAINSLTQPLVVAIDVPSGLDADTGLPDGAAIEADRTITFLASKPGLASASAKCFCGEIAVADIGLPDQAISTAIHRTAK